METVETKKLDWSKLSFEEFNKIEKEIQERIKRNKEGKKIPRQVGNIICELNGKKYSLKMAEYTRLKSIKSQKSKEKYINKLISLNNPITEI